MTSRAQAKSDAISRDRSGEGSDAITFHVAFAPYDRYTYVTATLHRGYDRRGSVLSLYSGRLAITRNDLRGQTPRDILTLLCGELRTVGTQPDTESEQAAVGSGAPLGAKGGSFPNTALPGME